MIIGAYAAASTGLPEHSVSALAKRVALLQDVTGFELPLTDAESPWLATDLLDELEDVAPGLRHVVTVLPALVAATRADATIGLASTVERSRRAALEIVDRARVAVLSANALRADTVSHVAIQSSPLRSNASVDAFAASVSELLDGDWGGARLAVEHCDTLIVGQPHQKGYLRLDEELSIIADFPLLAGVTINWGRSAIEARSSRGPIDHIVAASTSLAGLMFSGTSSRDSVFGTAWADVHTPPREYDRADASASLLGRAEVEAAVDALAAAPAYLGVKVATHPGGAIDDRIAAITSALALVRNTPLYGNL